MKIGVISDTHGNTWAIKEIVDALGNVDCIIHLGDNVRDTETISQYFSGKIIKVKGNCDYCNNVDSEIVEEISGKRFFITHGHKYNVKYDFMRLKYKALEVQADIVLFGHTHCSSIFEEEGILFINPGSAVVPRDGRKSLAIIEIVEGEIHSYIRFI